MTLADDTTSFLEANGWLVTNLESRLISGTRPSLGDVNDQVLVWIPESTAPSELRLREQGYLRRFADHMESQSQRFLLVPSTEGFSAEFRRQAKSEFRVTVTTPIQFFDAPFKWDLNPATATAASALRGRSSQPRIPQPFDSTVEYESYGDLLKVLIPAFKVTSISGPQVHLVTAPAGYGKSHLFQSLFSQLYDDFIEAKRSQTRAMRPLPLLPEYIASATAPTLKAIVTSFLATDVARPLTLDSFEWMLTRGYACFLIDGLDEVIARDPHFFEYLYELLTQVDSPHPVRILVCVRDSLLASNKGLRDFLEEAGDLVARHRLAPWSPRSVEAYVGLRARSTKDSILGVIRGSADLDKLSQTPFYCELMVDSLCSDGKNSSPLDSVSSATRLMALAVRGMVEREFAKSLLSRHWATPEEIESLIQDIAEENLEGGSKGVQPDEVAEVALYSLPTDLDPDDLDAAVEHIKQLPFFSASGDVGRLSFAQEVVYDYLLGVRSAKYFASNPRRFLQLMGFRPLARDSVTVNVLHEAILEDGSFDDLFKFAVSATGEVVAFRNILQIVLGLEEAAWIVSRLSLERQDLSGLVFRSLDLGNVSMRGSNLEAMRFVDCTLSGAVFAEAVIKSTIFENCVGLSSVEYGDLSTFFSAVIDGDSVSEPQEFLSALGVERLAENTKFIRPCDAANQLRFLFSKYVRPDGAPRRDWQDEKALLSGRRYVDPGPVLAAAIRHGYLVLDPGRARYMRSRGEQYSEMVGLVSKLQLSARMRALLSDICRQPGCRHLLDVELASPSR